MIALPKVNGVNRFSVPGDATRREYTLYIIVAWPKRDKEKKPVVYAGKTGDNREGCNPIISRVGNHFSLNKVHSQLRNRLVPKQPTDYDYEVFYSHFGEYMHPEKGRAGIDRINRLERRLRSLCHDSFPTYMRDAAPRGGGHALEDADEESQVRLLVREAAEYINYRQKLPAKMKRIFAPTQGPYTWRALLAKPETQWRDGRSAKELARSWENAWLERQDFPAKVSGLLTAYGPPFTDNLKLVSAIPEYQVEIHPVDARPSCNDIFVLASTGSGLVVIMVEGKAGEDFGPRLGEWLAAAPKGSRKNDRLTEIRKLLGISAEVPNEIRYQLLHRAASAVITAQEYKAPYAVMLVHSFSDKAESFEDYKDYLNILFQIPNADERLVSCGRTEGIELYCGWVQATKG